MRVNDALKLKDMLQSSTANFDVELLLCSVLNKDRGFLYAYPECELTKQQEQTFDDLLKRRISGEPMAYILGKKEFWSLEFFVDKNVLIPRPETELLVEIALQFLKSKKAVVADVGTGSGAIALALAREQPTWKIIATDICENALKIAERNAFQLGVKNVEFFCGDWCDALPKIQFDAIISNPPYIKKNDHHLRQGDVRFEPKIALEAEDGFSAISKIIKYAKDFLVHGGVLMLEHGFDQSEHVQILFEENNYREIKPHQDFSGIYRAVSAIKN